MTMDTVLMDFMIVGLIFIISKFIRSKLKFLQRLFIPTGIIAGFIIMAGWKYGFKFIPFSEGFGSSYATAIVILVLSSLFIGRKKKISLKDFSGDVLDAVCVNNAAYFSQYGLALLAGVPLTAAFGLYEGFGLSMPTGFAGGHGTAASVGAVLASSESGAASDPVSFGIVFATVGLLTGIIGGVISINIAARKGQTSVVKKPAEAPEEMVTGYYDKNAFPSVGSKTICSMSMETLTFHFAFILLAALFATLIAQLVKKTTGYSVPAFSLAPLTSMIVNKLANILGFGDYLDENVAKSIGGMCADFVMAFAVGTVNLTLAAQNWLPIVIMVLVGWLHTFGFLWGISRRVYKKDWLERGLFTFGWSTGNTATSVVLLRLADPDGVTGALADQSTAWLTNTPFDVISMAILPAMAAAGLSLRFGLIWTGFSIPWLVILLIKLSRQKKVAA